MNNGMDPNAANGRSVILIGADGFIGTEIHRHLASTGWNVLSCVYARRPRADERRLDVTRADDFRSLPEGMPVVNAAGLPDQSVATRLMRKVHVRGMRNLTEWAVRTQCPHIVQMSSVSVYGNATVGIGRSEDATKRRTWNPLSASLPYGRTKARAEAVLERSGTPWSALRLPAVYGPGDSFLSRQLHRLITGSDAMPPGGSKPVSLFPIDDIGPLIERVLEHGPLDAALNAAGTHVPWMEILETYANALGTPLRFAPRVRIADFLAFADPGRQMAVYYGRFGAEFPDDALRARLGWTPETDWRKTARRAAEALADPAPGR